MSPTKKEILNLLSQITKLVNELDENQENHIDTTELCSIFMVNVDELKRLNDELVKLNTDIKTIKKVMEKVDKEYGKTENYIVTKPLFEVL